MTTAKTQAYEQVCSSTMFLILTILLIWLVGANHTVAEAGSMLISDTDPSLALNAYGGAKDGTILKLVKNCPPNNSDCTWTYRNGMLISDTDPSLAVNAYGGAKDGTILKLVKNCPQNIPDCTWKFLDRPAAKDAWTPELRGYADIHNHQFANMAFGGKFVYGKSYGPLSVAMSIDGDIAQHGWNHVGEPLGAIMDSRHGSFLGNNGFPRFDHWPSYRDTDHQKVYKDWLERAVRSGLRLMVMR